MTAWLLHWSKKQNLRPVVLTRGYRAAPPSLPYRVRMDSPAKEAGDEPLLLQQGCPEATILVDPKRIRAGLWAARLQPDLFILDDGMQHLAVQRDINLVLLREIDLEDQWNQVIPAGSWRESKSALQSASAFMIKCTRLAPEDLLTRAEKRLGAYGKPLFTFSLCAKRCIAVKDGTEADLQPPYLIATGIADSMSVAQTARTVLNVEPETVLAFPDHHEFETSDWEKILKTCERHAVKSILCTPKDAVKLQKFNYNHLYTFDMTLAFGPYANSRVPFPGWLLDSLGNCQQKRNDNERYSNN